MAFENIILTKLKFLSQLIEIFFTTIGTFSSTRLIDAGNITLHSIKSKVPDSNQIIELK